MNLQNQHEMTNKILLTVFSMMAETEQNFVSEHTQEGLHAHKDQEMRRINPKMQFKNQTLMLKVSLEKRKYLT